MIEIKITNPASTDKQELYTIAKFLFELSGNALVPVVDKPQPECNVAYDTDKPNYMQGIVDPCDEINYKLPEFEGKPAPIDSDKECNVMADDGSVSLSLEDRNAIFPDSTDEEVEEITSFNDLVKKTGQSQGSYEFLEHSHETETVPLLQPAVPVPPPPVPAPTFTPPPAPAMKDLTLDSEGNPWDARIHSRTKSKNEDGTWKLQRGLNPKREKVQKELRQAVPEPVNPFVEFMTWLAPIFAEGKFSAQNLSTLISAYGVNSVPELGSRIEIIPVLKDQIKSILANGQVT